MRPNDQQASEAQRQPLGMHELRGVYQFIYRHVGNREEAEALTERVFMLVITSQATRDAPGSATQACRERLLAWRARGVVVEYLRSFYPTLPPLSDDDIVVWPDSDSAGGVEDNTGAAQRAARLLAQLTAQDRDFLTYRFLDNRSLAETAARMRLTLAQALAMQWSALSHAAQVGALQAPSCPTPCGSDGEFLHASC
jgi:RNA polymerase sigma-70 factor (ECF subfamily)